MKRADKALLSLVKSLGLESDLRLYLIGTQWETIFSGPLSLHSSPSRLKGGELLITLDSPAWLQQMSFYKTEMLGKLSGLGVREIRFKLGRVSKKPPPPPPHTGWMPEKARPFIEEVLSAIKDEELRLGVRRAMEKWAAKGGQYDTRDPHEAEDTRSDSTGSNFSLPPKASP